MSQVVRQKDNSKRRYNGECACVDGHDKNKKCKMRWETKDEMTLSKETRYRTRWWVDAAEEWPDGMDDEIRKSEMAWTEGMSHDRVFSTGL